MVPSRSFVECSSPSLFPPVVAHSSIRLFGSEGDWCSQFGLELPSALASAAPKRRRDFLAGRYCARLALEKLAPELAAHQIEIGPGREPIWPAGLVGSITHTDGFASAAVAWRRDVLALGLDSERLRSSPGVAEIESQVFEPSELEALRADRLSRQQVAFLGFSAKEAVFKCLYPLSRTLWEFDEIALTTLDPKLNLFAAKARKERALKAWPLDGVQGRYALDGTYVHTGAFVPVL